jgi:adenylate cyclase
LDEKQKELAEKATALDPNLAEAHLSLGLALQGSWEWESAEKEIKRSLELNPGLVLAWDQYAWLLTVQGRFDQAISNQQKAVELDPLSAFTIADLAEYCYFSRRYEQAIVQSRKALQLDQTFAWAHFTLAWSLLRTGEADAAITEFEEARKMDDLPMMRASLGYAYAVSGDVARGEQILRELGETANQRYVSPWGQAVVYLGLGQREKALDGLDQCYLAQDLTCSFFKVDPLYDSLRNEPRFRALLKKVGLEK